MPYGGCTHRIHRYSGFVQEDIIDCRPDACHGRKYGIGLEGLVTKGMPAKLQIACVIASQQGVEHLEKLFPGDEVTLWCAAIDPEMNEHSYIVPGLGDAGDLAFGDKI